MKSKALFLAILVPAMVSAQNAFDFNRAAYAMAAGSYVLASDSLSLAAGIEELKGPNNLQDPEIEFGDRIRLSLGRKADRQQMERQRKSGI